METREYLRYSSWFVVHSLRCSLNASLFFFQFSDILVVARNTKHGQYRVQFKIEVSEMKVWLRRILLIINNEDKLTGSRPKD